MDEHSKPVVLEFAVALAAALHVFDTQIEALRRAVARSGAVVFEDLGAPGAQGPADRSALCDLFVEPGGDRLVDDNPTLVDVVGEIYVTDKFFSEPGAEHLVAGIADAEPEEHPVAALVVEPFVSAQEELAGPVERIILAASVTERLVLDATADLVDATVADAQDVDRIGNRATMREKGAASGAVAVGQLGGHHRRTSAPLPALSRAPSPQVCGAVLIHVNERAGLEIDQPRRVNRGTLRRCPSDTRSRPLTLLVSLERHAWAWVARQGGQGFLPLSR